MRNTSCFLGSAKNRFAAILAALILIAGGFTLLSVALPLDKTDRAAQLRVRRLFGLDKEVCSFFIGFYAKA